MDTMDLQIEAEIETVNLKDFAVFIRHEKFNEYVKQYVDLFIELKVPLMQLFKHLSYEELIELSKISVNDFLISLEQGTALQRADESLKKWKENKIESVPKNAIQPSDLILVYAAQKKALIHFIPSFTNQSKEAVSIIEELEDYFMQIQDKAVQTLFNIQRETEQQLQESEERYRDIFENGSDLIQLMDEQGKLLYVNNAWIQNLGYSREEIKDFTIKKIIDPAVINNFYEYRNQVLQNGNEGKIETVFVAKNGKRINVEGTINAKIENGKIKYTRGIYRDISEKKKTEALLTEINLKLNEAQQLSKVGNWEWNLITDKLFWSDQLYRIYGLSPHEKEVDYLNFLQYVHPADRESVNEIINLSLSKKTSFDYFHRIITEENTIKHIHARGEILLDPTGKPIKMKGISQDVTELREAEQKLSAKAQELERSNSELEQFAYVASHDLQEPLRKVISFGDRLATKFSDKLGVEGINYINRMQISTVRMQRLIDDLLIYSKFSKVKESFIRADLNELVLEVLGDLDRLIENKNAAISLHELPVLPVIPRQIKQLFQNLLTNAIKFTEPNTSPIIEISAKEKQTNWEIIVKDNGIGIEKQYADKIFVIFQRLHGKEQYEGTGIGLAICKKIVESHNGNIRVESSPGTGSTFIITLNK